MYQLMAHSSLFPIVPLEMREAAALESVIFCRFGRQGLYLVDCKWTLSFQKEFGLLIALENAGPGTLQTNYLAL